MFMFVFAIILIALVGLFLQVMSTLTLYLSSQQMGMGQQIFTWHNLAREYACSAGLALPAVTQAYTAADPVAAGIHNMRPEYAGRYWGAAIFSGLYGGAATTPIVLAYIPTSGTFGGYTMSDVVRQFRGSFKSNEYKFSAVYTAGCPSGRCMDVVVSSAGTFATVTVSGIPTTVPNGAAGMVSVVKCTP